VTAELVPRASAGRALVTSSTSPAVGEAADCLLRDAGADEKEVPVAIHTFMVFVGAYPEPTPNPTTS
jgi:hypothetical protein